MSVGCSSTGVGARGPRGPRCVPIGDCCGQPSGLRARRGRAGGCSSCSASPLPRSSWVPRATGSSGLPDHRRGRRHGGPRGGAGGGALLHPEWTGPGGPRARSGCLMHPVGPRPAGSGRQCGRASGLPMSRCLTSACRMSSLPRRCVTTLATWPKRGCGSGTTRTGGVSSTSLRLPAGVGRTSATSRWRDTGPSSQANGSTSSGSLPARTATTSERCASCPDPDPRASRPRVLLPTPR